MAAPARWIAYQLVSAESPQKLADAVQAALGIGWEPQGGPLFISIVEGSALVEPRRSARLVQAMTLPTASAGGQALLRELQKAEADAACSAAAEEFLDEMAADAKRNGGTGSS
jgi:hypothetical protein